MESSDSGKEGVIARFIHSGSTKRHPRSTIRVRCVSQSMAANAVWQGLEERKDIPEVEVKNSRTLCQNPKGNANSSLAVCTKQLPSLRSQSQ